MSKQNWGILSAGLISNDFVNAINDPTGPAAELCKIVAVAARDLDRAKSFAKVHSIPRAYGSYKELADDSEIDIVYVGNTVGHHYDVVKMLLEAKKHVLCEKSITPTVEQAKELFELAKSKNLFLMEAVWSNFMPTYKKLHEVISAGTIGEVIHVEVNFCMIAPDWLSSAERGGGATKDAGIYNINLIRVAFQNEEPQEIVVRGDFYESGVDREWDAILIFSNNRRAVAKCSGRYALDNYARISGSKGVIQIPAPFHCSPEIIINGEKFSYEFPSSKPVKDYTYVNSSALAYEAAAVCQAVNRGQIECEEYTTANSIYTQKMLDEILRQVKTQAK